ncbi:MAG: SpoIIE family protein phosphatase, partial [Bacteroidales bacterium]|nr:SpoIIE family protein phosphatase [Bacteroidales bacterium]
KPRDVVSGDFYYYAKVDNKVIVAAVDCTGHGVPGAFLSMIGNNILSRVVEYEKITQPDKILSELDAGVRSSLNQVHTDNRDGMDIALITIDYDNNSIQFAGAGNPLIYFINNEQFMIKGSPVAIGGYSIKSEKVFELNEFSFEKNDEIELYLFSDGFIDQFNADDNKRYMRKRFKVLLDGLHQKKMKEQELALNTEILEWRGQIPQLDDVIVIGLRV